ncbi:hypothetical protein R3P38DRAFT_3193049 [Favolaschia claudopus]|uniref:Uncharacterized protein n=1 Tax=Favolaschia claudopus TaxID=2862362 RepID=A0AAW0BKH1_9AGAR
MNVAQLHLWNHRYLSCSTLPVALSSTPLLFPPLFGVAFYLLCISMIPVSLPPSPTPTSPSLLAPTYPKRVPDVLMFLTLTLVTLTPPCGVPESKVRFTRILAPHSSAMVNATYELVVRSAPRSCSSKLLVMTEAKTNTYTGPPHMRPSSLDPGPPAPSPRSRCPLFPTPRRQP